MDTITRTLFKRIKDVNYVVQRGWREVVDDLDLFVSEEDYELLEEIVGNSNLPYKVDIRHPSDGYYPPEISELLLEDRRFNVPRGCWIPSKKAYFLALFYHSQVHGREEKYVKELKRAFLDWIPPTKPDDEGVVYNT